MRLLPALTIALPLLLIDVAHANLWCQDIVSGTLRIQRIVNSKPVETYPLGVITQSSDSSGYNYLGVNATSSRFTFSACDTMAMKEPGVIAVRGRLFIYGKIRWARTVSGQAQTGCLTRNPAGAIVFGPCAIYDGEDQLSQLWHTELTYSNVAGPAGGTDQTVDFGNYRLGTHREIRGGFLYGKQFVCMAKWSRC